MLFFFFQAEDGIRDTSVTGVQTCALPIFTGTPTAGDLSESASRSLPPGAATWRYFEVPARTSNIRAASSTVVASGPHCDIPNQCSSAPPATGTMPAPRSEEHTSELQSPMY